MIKTNGHRTDFTTMEESLQPLLRQFPRFPYGMHYWYFNIVTPKTRQNYTYILANVSIPTKLNGKNIQTDKDMYMSVLSDFSRNTVTTKEEKVVIKDGVLSTSDFSFTIRNQKAYVTLGKKKFVFDNFLSDSYVDTIGFLYDWASANFGNGHQYMNAESVMKRGPLLPWNWLHFFLEDGTYIKTFQLPFGHVTPLRVNDTQLFIDKVEYTKKTVKYSASKGELFFQMTVGLGDFDSYNEYTPRFSPTWRYNQYSPYLIEMKTNLKNINPNQKGGGILEIAKGWSF